MPGPSAVYVPLPSRRRGSPSCSLTVCLDQLPQGVDQVTGLVGLQHALYTSGLCCGAGGTGQLPDRLKRRREEVAARGRGHESGQAQVDAAGRLVRARERVDASPGRSGRERVRPDAPGREVGVLEPVPLDVLELLGDAGLVGEEEQAAVAAVFGQPSGAPAAGRTGCRGGAAGVARRPRGARSRGFDLRMWAKRAKRQPWGSSQVVGAGGIELRVGRQPRVPRLDRVAGQRAARPAPDQPGGELLRAQAEPGRPRAGPPAGRPRRAGAAARRPGSSRRATSTGRRRERSPELVRVAEDELAGPGAPPRLRRVVGDAGRCAAARCRRGSRSARSRAAGRAGSGRGRSSAPWPRRRPASRAGGRARARGPRRGRRPRSGARAPRRRPATAGPPRARATTGSGCRGTRPGRSRGRPRRARRSPSQERATFTQAGRPMRGWSAARRPPSRLKMSAERRRRPRPR